MYLKYVHREDNMRLAIIGSRSIKSIPFEDFVPNEVTEIVSGGACGVDSAAKEFARKNGIAIIEFLPKYSIYGKAAPIKRNEEIVAYADEAIAFWDGKSRGTEYTIRLFKKSGKKIRVILQEPKIIK